MASPDVTETSDVSLSELKTMQSEMESRRLVLTKSWDELSHLMSRYHSSLVLKHEVIEQSTQPVDVKSKFARLEQTVNRKDDEIKRYCKMISDLETKLLNKDSEIVRLRAENRKLVEDATMKNNLLNKLQAQMAREALEYSSEINALKEMLESGECGPRKRRRAVEDNGELEATVTQYKTDSSPPTTAENSRLFDPPTFSIATMPHLTLPTTSTEALKLDSVDANEAAENGNGRYSKLYEVVEHEEHDDSDEKQDGVVDGLLEVEASRGRSTLLTSFRTKIRRQRGVLTPYSCSECGKQFTRSSNLRQHLKIHENFRPFVCKFCSRSFLHKHHMKRHVDNVHMRTYHYERSANAPV